MQRFFKGLAEFFMPVPTKSKFAETGQITPEEFVLAGDLLVHKCSTWTWEAGDPSKAKSYLPPTKQFLVTRQVPCVKRIKDLGGAGREEIVVSSSSDGGDDWVLTNVGEVVGEVLDLSEAGGASGSGAPAAATAVSIDDVPDMEDFDTAGNILEDPGTTLTPAKSNILKTRTYDVSITFDFYYGTPRVWLYGVDEHGAPLSPDAIMEDVYSDYAGRTVTIEPHPHLPVQMASIHPCKHANVMKRMIDNLADDGKYIRVDLYMFLFLKFISCVIPTINYDFTIEMDTGGSASAALAAEAAAAAAASSSSSSSSSC